MGRITFSSRFLLARGHLEIEILENRKLRRERWAAGRTTGRTFFSGGLLACLDEFKQ